MSHSEDIDDPNPKRTKSCTEKTKRIRGESSVKYAHRDQRYRRDWEQHSLFRGWINPVPNNAHKARCSVCDVIVSADITSLKRHAEGKKHQTNNRAIGVGSHQRTLVQCVQNDATVKLKTEIKQAEIRHCAFLAEKNIAIRAVESLVAMNKKSFPDSKIAEGMELGRTKATLIINNVIGRCHSQELAAHISSQKFSAIIDESTDIGSVKTMSVCVRFHDGKQVVTKFSKLVQIFSAENAEEAREGAKARRLYEALIKSLTEANVPLENLIGFASDGCSTMFGRNNSVAQKLQEALPGITTQKCICHSLHLCASDACKELPRSVEDFARNIYSVFKCSAKRQAEFHEFQNFFNTDPHKILHPSQTRWLSLLAVVNRILEQWDAHKNFFNLKPYELRLLVVDSILSVMNDPTTKLYYFFLQWALPKFVDLNEMFQSERSLITVVHQKMCTSYKDLLYIYMDRTYVDRTPLEQLNPADSSKFIPLQQMYLGVKLMKGLSDPLIMVRNDRSLLENHFRQRCRSFLIRGCTALKERFDFSDGSPFAKMSVLHPSVALSKDVTRPASLIQLIFSVPRICDPEDLDRMQVLDDQWRLMPARTFPSFTSSTDADAFWTSVRDSSDIDGKKEFQDVAKFALDVMSLPHSSASCERVFSKVNLTKTKTRNRLQTNTLNGLLLTSQCSVDGGGSSKFSVTDKMVASMTVENLKPQKRTGAAAGSAGAEGTGNVLRLEASHLEVDAQPGNDGGLQEDDFDLVIGDTD